MTANAICLPIDANAGAPSFAGADTRVAFSALMAGRTDRPLGALSGVKPGADPTLTATATQWTVTPFAAVVDPGTAAAVGPYLVAFSQNVTGAINAADSTNTRTDRLDLVVPDDPAGSFGSLPVIQYKAGTPGSGTPAAPARSIPLALITVPKAGSGNPSISPAYLYTTAAGGIVPVSGASAYPAHPHVGQYVDDPTLGLVRWDGAAWKVIAGKDQAYTPALGSTAGSQPTGWTTSGNYRKSDRWVEFEATFEAQSGFAAGSGAYYFGLPVAPDQTSILAVGDGVITNTAYNFIAIVTSDTPAATCCLYQPGSTTRVGAGGPYGNAWAALNTVRITGRYRAAS